MYWSEIFAHRALYWARYAIFTRFARKNFKKIGAVIFIGLISIAYSPERVLAAEEISVVVSGKYRGPLPAYKIGSLYYLNAKQAGELYGGQIYWYPVSGRVQMALRGRAIQMVVGSGFAKISDKAVKMDAPVILRGAQAYIPLSFFLGDDFSAWSGRDTIFNAATRFLSVDGRSSVGPVRWFSYGDYTRLVVEISKGTGYRSSMRGARGREVVFPLGVIESSEKASIDDGILSYYQLRQNLKAATLSVKIAKPEIHWRIKELGNPRRLVIDLYSGKAPDTAQPPLAPAASAAAAPVAAVKTDQARRRIVIDAGHGGKDPGAEGRRGTKEKDINLMAAQELARLLREEEAFDVFMTRTDDTFVPLSDRSKMANDFGADLFISLHCNASIKWRENGFEVYFLSENASDPEAARLAEFENSVLRLEGKSAQDEQAAMILQELSKTENINAASQLAALIARGVGRRVDFSNRGVKQAAFYVLRGTHAPAVLFEMAFLTNKQDEARLESKKFRRKIIDGLYAGILDYAKRQACMAESR